jgi:hypothetical protein
LHLGGPDNITAYSLEDSKLWLRHLLTVVVQVLGAAYVLYKQYRGSGSPLLLAAVLMFAVGVVKYGERTWALMSGNIDTIRSTLKKEPHTKCHSHIEYKPHQMSFSNEGHFKREADEEEFLVRSAHALFHICKYAVVDDSSYDNTGDTRARDATILRGLTDEQKYAVTEIELSLMYDMLYTKVSVIHNWIGYCIGLVSPLATAGSLLIFQFNGRGGQNIVDVAITYVLLLGAFLLEVTSLLRALGSSWTFASLCAARWIWLRHAILCSGRWHRFRRKVVSLRHLFKVMGISRYFIPSRRWSGSMGQYNMLHFCTRRDTSYSPLLGWLAKLLRQEDWWETYHYSGAAEIPEKVKELVFQHLKRIFQKDGMNTLGVIRKNWGQQTIKRWPEWNLEHVHLGAEFQEGIIIWHIATELLLIRSKITIIDQNAEPTVEAIKALSNYMMFLLVDRPDMLPGLAQKRLYQRTCTYLDKEWRKVVDDPAYHQPTRNACTMLKELLCLHDNPNSNSRRAQREKLARKLLEDEQDQSRNSSRVRFAVDVANKLFAEEEKKSESSLQLLLEMWIDFLVYAANRCSRESHAKKLNSGGEFTTVLWLLTEHLYQVIV